MENQTYLYMFKTTLNSKGKQRVTLGESTSPTKPRNSLDKSFKIHEFKEFSHWTRGLKYVEKMTSEGYKS